MVLRFYPKKDTTIYEQYPEKNTGLDAMLEVNKFIDGANYNSRILLDFDYSAVSASIVSLGKDPNQFNYHLKLYTAEAKEIPVDYILECYAISDVWDMGVGRYGNVPETKDGASWYYKKGVYSPAYQWSTGSFAPLVTASWSTNPGGGTWYTSSIATQSFSYTTSDVDMDVTSIVREVQSGSFNFNGFIIKKREVDELSADVFNSLKFFSKDTHTVYIPVLEARFDDSIDTGSLSYINNAEDFNVVAVNLKGTYNEASTPTIRFSARYRYPTQTFSTSSVYLDRYKLPSGSLYAVRSAHSDDMIVNFDEGSTKVSHDDMGSYIQLYLDSFQPERYYKLLLKVPNSDTATYDVYDENWIFKVTRS